MDNMIEQIKKTRECKGMSRYRLSQLTGIPQSTLMRYENGDIKKLDIAKVKAICEALEIDILKII